MLQYCLQHGISYVVVDTATQCMAFNQLDEQQVQQGINVLRRMAVALQGCVILTKHPSMSGRANGTGESGSVQWNNAVRSRLYMRETAADGLILSGMKANYGPKLEKIRLKWQRGVFIQDSPEPVRHWLDRED
jgi:RecA-family ATPase